MVDKIYRNSNFVNPMKLPLLCKKAEAVALTQPGLKQSGRQNAAKFRDF